MNRLNISLNFVISVNHNSAENKNKRGSDESGKLHNKPAGC
jgi:hypothetical protein